jgi:predicted aconitase with swiveling domain
LIGAGWGCILLLGGCSGSGTRSSSVTVTTNALSLHSSVDPRPGEWVDVEGVYPGGEAGGVLEVYAFHPSGETPLRVEMGEGGGFR